MCWWRRREQNMFFPQTFFYVQVYFYYQFCSFTKKKKKPTTQGPTAKAITHAHADSQELSQRSAWSGWLCAGVSEDFGRRNWKSLYQKKGSVGCRKLPDALSLSLTKHSMKPFQLEKDPERENSSDLIRRHQDTNKAYMTDTQHTRFQ